MVDSIVLLHSARFYCLFFPVGGGPVYVQFKFHFWKWVVKNLFRVVSLSQVCFELSNVLFEFIFEKVVQGSRNVPSLTKPFFAPGG